MDIITGPYLPLDLTTEERAFVFKYYAMKSALFSATPTQMYPHFIKESEAHWQTPIFSDRIVQTPDYGMRLILSASMLINPMYSFNANGMWNHVAEVAGNFPVVQP